MIDHDRRNLLANIAHQYFDKHRTQAEIAAEFGYSPSGVSRLLNEARKVGVVEIRINYPLKRAMEMEQDLRQRFNLNAAYVLERQRLPYKQMLRRVGRLGAQWLAENLPHDCILGIGSGVSLYEVVEALDPHPREDVLVVQVSGGIGRVDPIIDGPALVFNLARKIGGAHNALHAPHVVENPRTRDLLLEEPSIREVLELASLADICLVGIGGLDASVSTLHQAGYLSADDLTELRDSGAAGDILGTHFSIAGEILDLPINQRVVAVPLSEYVKQETMIVGVAGDRRKAPAILGALRGGLIHVLVTDTSAADEVLKLSSTEEEGLTPAA